MGVHVTFVMVITVVMVIGHISAASCRLITPIQDHVSYNYYMNMF